MSPKTRFTVALSMALLVFILSAVMTVPVLADDGTPPVEETAVVADTGEEATEPSVSDETQPAPAEEVSTPPVPEEPALSDLPEGIDVVVLDESNESVPLATEEAADIVATADPIWCPASVTVPTPGLN